MVRRRGLTRIELLVLIGAVVFIILLILLTQHKAKRRPRVANACLVSLKDWGIFFAMYTRDNNGHFFSGEGRGDGYWWIEATRSYWQNNPQRLLCPKATKPLAESDHSPFATWTVSGVTGSYGMNGWICDPPQGKTELWGQGPIENYWRTVDVNEADNVPVFFDATRPEAWPRETDNPPKSPGEKSAKGMQRVCCDRHEGFVNILFMDWSVRKVSPKELWKLKWHRDYNTDGPWTRAGGVQPMDWPEWMRHFRDY
jgi:prepilin-type processing-associated H-X9-DG protein